MCTLAGRSLERRLTLCIRSVDIGFCSYQQIHDFDISVLCRSLQRHENKWTLWLKIDIGLLAISSFTISIFPICAAILNGVNAERYVPLTKAFAASKSFTISRCPYRVAYCNAVRSNLSIEWALTLAFATIKLFTASTSPITTAS